MICIVDVTNHHNLNTHNYDPDTSSDAVMNYILSKALRQFAAWQAGSILFAGLVLLSMGFWTDAEAQTCYTSSITSPTPFMGNDGEIFRLSDGSVWEVKYEYEYLYEYYPQVVICPSRGILIIDGGKLTFRRSARRRQLIVRPPPNHLILLSRRSTVHLRAGRAIRSSN